jgi:molecular chaperone GrpE
VSDADARHQEETPVVRDKRRIDPDTGAVREQPAAAAPGRPADSTDAQPAAAPGVSGEVEALTARVEELTGDVQRVHAEYANYRKRVDRDRALVSENAVASVLIGLLPVLDDIDRAREHGEVEGGFKAVADSLERIVAGQGLVKFGTSGDEFDPNYHEALMHAHSPDVTTTTCQTIISAGYMIGDRVVRPARVTVVDPEPADAAPAETGPAAEPGGSPGQDTDDE